VAGISDGDGDEGGEQVLDLVAGHCDQPGRCRVAGAFDEGDDDQEGVGEHGQGGPAVPGAPAADLMLVQADQAFGGLEAFLDGPAASGDPDQGGQRDRAWRPAVVEGQLAGGAVAAHQQPALPGVARVTLARVELDKRPVVVAVALGALAGRDALPGPHRNPPAQGVGAVGVAGGPDAVIAGHREHITDASGLQLGP
jgi:hypothetical protein